MQIRQLGISTTLDYSIPFEEMLPLIRKAGFDAVALGGGDVKHSGYDTPAGREKIGTTLDLTGLFLDSIHAPFGKKSDISSDDEGIRCSGCDGVIAALEACCDLGASVVVLHLNSWFSKRRDESRFEVVERSLEQLIPVASELGVKMAAENLYGRGAMELFADVMASHPELGVCYDSSHAHLHSGRHSSSPYQVLDDYPCRILALHLSDVSRNVDDHLPLYSGKVDWQDFSRHLATTTYTGTLLLELNMASTSVVDPESFLKQAYEGATRLMKSFGEEVDRGR